MTSPRQPTLIEQRSSMLTTSVRLRKVALTAKQRATLASGEPTMMQFARSAYNSLHHCGHQVNVIGQRVRLHVRDTTSLRRPRLHAPSE